MLPEVLYRVFKKGDLSAMILVVGKILLPNGLLLPIYLCSGIFFFILNWPLIGNGVLLVNGPRVNFFVTSSFNVFEKT